MKFAMNSDYPVVNSKTTQVSSPELDASFRYELEDLLDVPVPEEPSGFAEHWLRWRSEALNQETRPLVRENKGSKKKSVDQEKWQVFDLEYLSTDEVKIRGWLLLPQVGPVRRGFVVGHGYGGRDGPDLHLPFPDAALLFPCARGLGRSEDPRYSSNANWHVLHNIQDPERYIFRGCAEDLWLGFSAMLELFPELEGHLGYLGISFGGGIGALSLAWEDRVARAHFNVPSFGHQLLRLRLPSLGSAASLQAFAKRNPGVAEKTLPYFDAAIAARHIKIPVHSALALADPMVTPPGQFAIRNGLSGPSPLFVLPAGHMEYPEEGETENQLLAEIEEFFREL